MKTHIKVFVTLITVIIIAMPLAGCSPSITRDDTEEEIVSFMLNFIIQNPVGGSAKYVQTSGQPWLNPPPSAVLIVYSPPNEKKDKNPWEELKISEPIKVWWYFDNKLVEATDNQVAVQKYAEYYMPNSWLGRYDFGILNISSNHKKATIYFSSSTCPECAGGMLYTIERNDSGKWEIIDSELLWLS